MRGAGPFFSSRPGELTKIWFTAARSTLPPPRHAQHHDALSSHVPLPCGRPLAICQRQIVGNRAMREEMRK